ncbi:MAG: alanine racemase [Calditrichaeota bacterium]|nr:MAG: alanine racemase [Calditrichota bacterium]
MVALFFDSKRIPEHSFLNTNHPTIAKIDLGAIQRNTERICAHCKSAEVMAVVKADAYGHGAVRVVDAVLNGGASRLAVAHLREALALRQAGVNVPIQVFGGFFKEQLRSFSEADLEFSIGNDEQIEWLTGFVVQRNIRPQVHIKFDTGMGRIGFPWQAAERVLAKLKYAPFHFIGLMTHFATSDEKNKDFAKKQLERFKHIITSASKIGLKFDYIHAANSGAILDMPKAHFNLVRPGVILYGNYPSQETSESIHLEPAMSLHSKIMQIKHMQAGEPVSYGATWQADRATVVAVVPIGYADGYLRGLSGKMHAMINGRRVPQIGRVCMDLTMFDLGPEAKDQVGDEVILLGSDGQNAVVMQEFCQALDTIPYEITCQISKRVPRIYTRD